MFNTGMFQGTIPAYQALISFACICPKSNPGEKNSTISENDYKTAIAVLASHVLWQRGKQGTSFTKRDWQRVQSTFDHKKVRLTPHPGIFIGRVALGKIPEGIRVYVSGMKKVFPIEGNNLKFT